MRHIIPPMLLISLMLASFLLIPISSGGIGITAAQPSSFETGVTNYTLIVEAYEWSSETPVGNVSFTLTMNETQIGGRTNSTGMFSYDWVGPRAQNVYAVIRALTLDANYSAIRVCNTMIDTVAISSTDMSVSYVGYYSSNMTIYDGILASLWPSVTKNRTYLICQMWMEKGRAVRISDYDPAQGGRVQLYVNPGLPVPDVAPTDYEGWYFVPIDYPITIMDVPDFTGATKYSPLISTIERNTTVINWTYHATVELYTKKLKSVEQRLIWYDSQGFPLEDERRDYLQTIAMFDQASGLIGRGNYSIGANYLSQAQERFTFVVSELNNVDNYIKMTALLVTIFSYGFSKLMPTLFMEDEKKRLLASVAIYFALFITFTLTQPHIKVALAMVIGSLTGYADQGPFHMDALLTITSAFVWSTLFYLLMFALSSVRTLSLAGFIMDVAMRNMKARRNRTLLTMATVALIVGSSVAFVNVASGRGIVETGRWAGTSRSCLIIEPRGQGLSRIEQYEVSWLRDQSWVKELGYVEPFSGDLQVGRQVFSTSVEVLRGEISIAEHLGGMTISTAFYQKYYNLSRYVIGSLPAARERGILISSAIPNVHVGDVVELRLSMVSSGQRAEVIKRSIGTFIVKGLFDPEQLSQITRLDGKQLFADAGTLILAPNGVLPSDIAQVGQVTAVTTVDADVVRFARELAFMFSQATTANADGQAVRFQEVFTLSIAGGWAQIIPLIIAGLLTYNIVGSTVLERKRDISTMAVIGANPTVVTQIFIAEVVVLGFISTLVGFFGSYFLNFLVMMGASLLGLAGVQISGIGLAAGQWSLSAIIVALFSGVVVTTLAGLIPTLRVQNISLMERTKRRVIPYEARRTGLLNEYVLPLRVPSLDGEMLFNFIKEVFQERLRDIEAKYDLYQDGTFLASFKVKGWAPNDVSAVVDINIRVERRGESLFPTLVFPDVLRESKPFQEFLYKLERNLISYTTWREARVRVKIVREAVSAPKVRTLEGIIGDLVILQQQIDEISGKLDKLESMRAKISTTVYAEFDGRYRGDMNKLIKKLRPLGMELEPYRDSLRKETRELTTRIEKISASYNLGEIAREAYEAEFEPLNSRLRNLKGNLDRIEELFRQLKSRVSA